MRFRTSLIFLLAALPAPAAALADQVGVMDRPRPDYDAKGVPVGDFRLKPALDVSLSGDDNVFRTPKPTVSDGYATIRGGFDLASDWSRHEVVVHASVTRLQYRNRQDENETDASIGAEGRLDIERGSEVDGSGSYNVLHEPRTSPDQPGNARKPTEYALAHGDIAFKHEIGIIGLSLGGNFNRFDYRATALTGGGVLDNRDRNHDQFDATAKITYGDEPGYGFFVSGTLGGQAYDLKLDRNGFDRNTTNFRADAGADLALTDLVDGEVFAGYMKERFNAPLKTASGVDYGGKLKWYATPLLTVHLTAQHLFSDTTLAGASVSDDKTEGVGFDYEFLRDLIVQTQFDFTDSRFVGIGRKDQTWDAGLSLKYLINRYMSATAGYTFSRRTSSDPTADFNDNLATAGLHFQL